MDVGEGFRFAGAIVTVGAILWLFVEGMAWVQREWNKMVDGYFDLLNCEPRHSRKAREAYERTRAEAMVPELAAANRAPDYKGKCRCSACRKRPPEPCSDFDGD